MDQKWHIETPWKQLKHAEDHPDGFFPDPAYEPLESHLENQEKTILRGLHEGNMRMRRRDARLWTI